MDCLTPALEFAVRRHWCLHQHLSLDAVAADFGMSADQLQLKLHHVEDLSFETLLEVGIQRLDRARCRDARLVGFPVKDVSEALR